ncbi:MAG: serine hydrolase domain-containing protein [Pseudomonadota bacterium]
MSLRLALAAAAASILQCAAPALSAEISDDPRVAARLRAANAWLETYLGHEAVPAGSFAIVHDQKIVWASGYGVADINGQVPVNADTRYSICSISKLFTSIAAMQLRDAGEIDLDAPIDNYLDWYAIKDKEGTDEPVTVRNILSHVSGLPRESDFPYWTTADFPTIEAVRARLQDQTELYQPYDQYQYSNLGMTLLGEIVAETSGQSYDAYIRREILDPLGMTSTTTDMPEALHGGSLAVGYYDRNGKGERAAVSFYTTNGIAPAAGFASSVNDLAKFASWQFRLRENGGEEILERRTLREMQRTHWTDPQGSDYYWGLGFRANNVNGDVFWGHSGYCPGYRADLTMALADKLAYIALVNVNDVGPANIARQLHGLTAQSVREAADDPRRQRRSKLARFEGVYANENFNWDQYIGFDGETLFSIELYTDRPADSYTEYEQISDTVFRERRDDGKVSDDMRFELDDDGNVIKLWYHSNYLNRQ